MSAIIVIPARMASRRLPGKALADIGGTPMVVHVWKRAVEADVGRVFVASSDIEIIDAVCSAGADGVRTSRLHDNGTSCCHEAAMFAKADIIINLQCDVPFIKPESIRAVLSALENDDVADMATLAGPLAKGELNNPNIVKVSGYESAMMNWAYSAPRVRRFSRDPWVHRDDQIYHHVGVYAFRRAALDKFVTLPQDDDLEQLAATGAGMRIAMAVIDKCPISVDTPADLERVRASLR